MKMYSLEKELECAGINENSNMRIGIDDKNGGVLITSVDIKDFLTSNYYERLLRAKVIQVINTREEGNENDYVFVLNVKR